MSDEPSLDEYDAGVRFVVRVLDRVEAFVPYEWLTRIERLRSDNLAYWYSVTWLAVLLAALATSRWWADHIVLQCVIVFVAAYRLLPDLLRWWLDLVLDPRHRALVSGERNLILAIINLGEVAIVAAVGLRTLGDSHRASKAAYDGFLLVTQMAIPATVSIAEQLVVILCESTALVILLGGLALVIAAVGQKIEITGKWQGEPRRRGPR